MCGIIGYTGSGDALPKMIKGLSVLEYRGYDSVGVAAGTEEGVRVVKCRGRVGELQADEAFSSLHASCAIGHTRWATHGGPSHVNAHPHRVGKVTLVHNGIIENHRELKSSLVARGVRFVSETDTEVAAALLDVAYAETREPISAIRSALQQLKGSYAFGILFEDRREEIYAVRCGSPLLLARGDDGFYLASDITALLPFTREYHILREGVIAALTREEIRLYREGEGKPLSEWQVSNMTEASAQKGGYAHFMQKEMREEPQTILQAITPRLKDGMPYFAGDGIDNSFWQSIRRIQIVACGSAMHAGLVGAQLIEKHAKIPVSVHVASEYRYHPPLSGKGTLVLIISQSGETADSLAALRYAKTVGLPTLAIVNAVQSSIAREAEKCIYTYAGPEIAVATTKGYCTQVAVLYLLAAALAHAHGRMPQMRVKAMVEELMRDAPQAMEEIFVRHAAHLSALAQMLVPCEHAFYIGRGMDYFMSMEGALKLKEISYIHTEAYAAGELKHGTISLIEEGTPVIALCTDAGIADKTESNVREVASRGARVILFCRADLLPLFGEAENVIPLSDASDAAALFSSLAAVQMLAYETARLRGCDIDRPRNLAKSVTVE